MKTNKEQNRVNTYFQDVTIKNACELLAIEKRLQLDGLVLPNNVIVNRNGISCVEFIQWYEKSQYPKTYVECAKILNCFSAMHIDGYKNELFEKLQELYICRDAYWKIAGEEMGLGKPWEPDFTDTKEMYYIFYKGYIEKGNQRHPDNHILIFPTPEMRDAFYENFKDLIEQCKELL